MAAAVVGVAVAADTRNEEGGVVAMGFVLLLVSGTVLVAARLARAGLFDCSTLDLDTTKSDDQSITRRPAW